MTRLHSRSLDDEVPDLTGVPSGPAERVERAWLVAHEGVVERRAVRYSGRVQGVGFRATAWGLARGLAVTGWVRNDADGTVCLEVQGEGGEVEGFLGLLRERMAGQIVREEVQPATVDPAERGFEVRH